jgi:hypothetical protein
MLSGIKCRDVHIYFNVRAILSQRHKLWNEAIVVRCANYHPRAKFMSVALDTVTVGKLKKVLRIQGSGMSQITINTEAFCAWNTTIIMYSPYLTVTRVLIRPWSFVRIGQSRHLDQCNSVKNFELPRVSVDDKAVHFSELLWYVFRLFVARDDLGRSEWWFAEEDRAFSFDLPRTLSRKPHRILAMIPRPLSIITRFYSKRYNVYQNWTTSLHSLQSQFLDSQEYPANCCFSTPSHWWIPHN